LTAERLREVLHYNPDTGVFTRLINTPNFPEFGIGAIAGNDNGQGYLVCSIKGTIHKCHRLAFVYMSGEWPTQEVDHMNGNRADNRWANLRLVTRAVNRQNMRAARSDNKAGLIGVAGNAGKWRAAICAGGKWHWLGNHSTPELAHAAYLEAKRRLHEGCTI
jgi:hypothetical protein